ncbi:MAG TPA: nucleoid-associated protein [Cytophagaceae bacterium]
MYNFADVNLKTLVVHSVGNKVQEEGMKLSKAPIQVEEEINTLLLKYFLSPFKSEVYYTFFHDADLNLNELFNYSCKIFSDPECFFLQSINITKHLYDSSDHHNIKGGEFYLTYMENCILDGEYVDAIGLFKSENKDTYLKVYQKTDNFDIEADHGININKLDKGCIIFNTETEKGYKVLIVDSTNKSNEAQYWKNDFLKVKPREDSYFHTQNYLHLCKDFCDEVLTKRNEVEKADKIMIMNRSLNYFQEKETFNIKEFENEVMEGPELIQAFQTFKNDYIARNNLNTYEEFDISESAVKSSKKIFKSILKLDKNFHIYIHGNRDMIVKGFDEERGLNYYQLFFKEER